MCAVSSSPTIRPNMERVELIPVHISAPEYCLVLGGPRLWHPLSSPAIERVGPQTLWLRLWMCTFGLFRGWHHVDLYLDGIATCGLKAMGNFLDDGLAQRTARLLLQPAQKTEEVVVLVAARAGLAWLTDGIETYDAAGLCRAGLGKRALQNGGLEVVESGGTRGHMAAGWGLTVVVGDEGPYADGWCRWPL